MAKNSSPNPKKKSENYYNLNTEAIDRLVNAEKNASKGPALKDPAKTYRSSFLDRIPNTVKALFIKFWFNGAICFYIIWGLPLTDYVDLLVVLSIVIGMVTDILVNNILRFIETVPGENNKWMMFTKKKYWTFFANIFYAGIVFNSVVWFYNTINVIINSITGNADTIALGVEPILFGLFYMIFDILFIGIKNMLKSIINDAKDKVSKG